MATLRLGSIVVWLTLFFAWLFFTHQAKASDDYLFGAAIIAVFDQNCRPISPSAMAMVFDVLSDTPPQEREAVVMRAQTLLLQSNTVTFCAAFADSVEKMEQAQD
jgi:hypothetical protein